MSSYWSLPPQSPKCFNGGNKIVRGPGQDGSDSRFVVVYGWLACPRRYAYMSLSPLGLQDLRLGGSNVTNTESISLRTFGSSY